MILIFLTQKLLLLSERFPTMFQNQFVSRKHNCIHAAACQSVVSMDFAPAGGSKWDPTRSEWNDRFGLFFLAGGGGWGFVYMLMKMGGFRNGNQQDLNEMVGMIKFWGAKRSSRCQKGGQNRGAYLLTLKEGVSWCLPVKFSAAVCRFLVECMLSITVTFAAFTHTRPTILSND